MAMKGALDSLGTNVFIADRDLKLVYMNRRAVGDVESHGRRAGSAFRMYGMQT
jgi:hypothetical protein